MSAAREALALPAREWRKPAVAVTLEAGLRVALNRNTPGKLL